MTRFVDLSHTITENMVTYPGLPGPTIEDHLSWEESRSHYAAGTEFRIARIEMVANTGTYLDTPAHRYRDGFDLGSLPLDSVAELPGTLIEATTRAIDEHAVSGPDVRGRAVLIRTGWSQHWATENYGSPEHPYLTAEAAESLARAGAALVGIDSVNIDDTSPAGGGHRPAHSTLLAAGIPVVEHLRGLDRLRGELFRFSAVPVKVDGMGTFPVRAFAALDDAD